MERPLIGQSGIRVLVDVELGVGIRDRKKYTLSDLSAATAIVIAC